VAGNLHPVSVAQPGLRALPACNTVPLVQQDQQGGRQGLAGRPRHRLLPQGPFSYGTRAGLWWQLPCAWHRLLSLLCSSEFSTVPVNLSRQATDLDSSSCVCVHVCVCCVLLMRHDPQGAFHARIAFCLNLHNEAVKAMRFEPDAHKRALAAANGRKEPTAEEIARELRQGQGGWGPGGQGLARAGVSVHRSSTCQGPDTALKVLRAQIGCARLICVPASMRFISNFSNNCADDTEWAGTTSTQHE